MKKFKLNVYYYDCYKRDFFKIKSFNKNSKYPYKIIYKFKTVESSNNVTYSYLNDLAQINKSYTDEQVKSLKEVILRSYSLSCNYSVDYGIL